MNPIEQKMSSLSDGELLDLIDNKSDEYTDQALKIAETELISRGRKNSIRSKIKPEKENADILPAPEKPGITEKINPELFITTETAFIDLKIERRLGIVTAEVALGINIFKDIFTAARDLAGGRSKTIQQSFAGAKETVIKELKLKASTLNADAIIGLKLEYNEISSGRSMLLLIGVGTAVKLDG